MKTANINIYNFDELTGKARRKAIDEHREFLLSIMRPEDFVSGCPEYDTPEELQKTHDSEYDYYMMNDDPIIEDIEANEYMFFADGTLANVTTYTATGNSVLTFHGEKINID